MTVHFTVLTTKLYYISGNAVYGLRATVELTSNPTPEYLRKLLEQNTFVCIQEHWLYSFEKDIIQNLLPEYSYSIKCSDDHNPFLKLINQKVWQG